MATVYSKTDNYGLNLYGDNDPADLRDGYNGSMRTIDSTLETHLNRIENVESRETHDEEVAKALLGDNTVNNATTAKTKWDKAASNADNNGAALAALGADTTAHATTAKTKWDKAASNADNNGAALAALGADTTAHATTAKTKWDKAASNADNNGAALAALGADTTAHATTAKTKWDKAGADATTAIGKADANKSILTALGADTTAHAVASKTKWDKNTTDIATILERLGQAQYEDGYLVTFGDSYADNTQNRTWSYQLAQMFPLLTWKNYAKSGAGFNVSGIPTFTQQVANCVADTAVDKNKVKVAVCAGGRNDILDYAAGHSKAQECVSAMRSAFPNAIVVIAPMLFDSGILGEDGMSKYSGLLNGCKDIAFGDSHIVLADGAYVWCKGNTNWFPSGDIHPNEQGAKAIARYLYTACRDSYRGRQEYAVSKFGDMRVEFLLQNAMITASGQGKIPIISNGKGGEMAKWCYPRHNIWNWIVTGGNTTQPTLAYIQPNGEWGVFSPTASMQGNCSFTASYVA